MLDLDICSSFTRNHRRKHQPKLPDCPDLLTADALPGRRIHAQVGTIVRSEQSALFRHRNNAEYERLKAEPSRFCAARRTAVSACFLYAQGLCGRLWWRGGVSEESRSATCPVA